MIGLKVRFWNGRKIPEPYLETDHQVSKSAVCCNVQELYCQIQERLSPTFGSKTLRVYRKCRSERHEIPKFIKGNRHWPIFVGRIPNLHQKLLCAEQTHDEHGRRAAQGSDSAF